MTVALHGVSGLPVNATAAGQVMLIVAGMAVIAMPALAVAMLKFDWPAPHVTSRT